MLESFLELSKLKNHCSTLKNVKCSLGKGSYQAGVVHRVGLDPESNKIKQTFSYLSCNFIVLRGPYC